MCVCAHLRDFVVADEVTARMAPPVDVNAFFPVSDPAYSNDVSRHLVGHRACLLNDRAAVPRLYLDDVSI